MDDARERLDAYREYLLEHGLPFQDDWVSYGRFTADSGCEGARRVLAIKRRPTALFCANDEVGVGAIRGARSLDLSIPEDVSVVGFDDVPLAMVCYPSLTTVKQPIGELSVAAVRALARLVNGDDGVPGQVFPTELIVRSSTTHPKEDPSL